jgi:3,2-trans-enoyl-CoA isomerase
LQFNVFSSSKNQGHAPAGGCVLAISCEYRLMLPYYKIGLNEAPVGIVATEWVMNSLRAVLPGKNAERLLTSGRLLDTQEAFDIGLIDQIVNNEEEAMARSEEFFSTFDSVPKLARALTKQVYRKNDIKQLTKNRSSDAKKFLNHILRPETQKIIGSYFKSLKDRKKD